MAEQLTFGEQLTVVQVPIDDLVPASYNPRTSDQAAEDLLIKSFRSHGVVDPLIVNSSKERFNIIIGGHFRWRVLKKLGATTVPVVYVDISDIETEKQLNLRLNRVTGAWDFELLKVFNIETLLDVGFDDGDLSAIWDEALATEDDYFDLDKAIREIKTPQTKPGDLFQLGSHLLICGDATDPAVIQCLVGSDLVSALYLDPPFNISLDYSKGISTNGKYGGSTDDHKSDPDYSAFLQSLLVNGMAVAKPDCHVFCYCDESYIGLLQSLYVEIGLAPKRVCLWIKNNFNMTPQIAFNKAYEPCVYGTRGKPYLSKTKNLTEILNKDVAVGNRSLDDILDLFNIWLAKRDSAQDYEHPTQKPPTLHEKPLRRCTKPGDIVLDVTAGSGSTMVACEQLKRRAYLAEAEPIFCDVIIARYEALTGQKAVKL